MTFTCATWYAIKDSFLFMLSSYLFMHVPQFICLFTSWWMGYFQLLAVMDKTAIDIVCRFLYRRVSSFLLGKYPLVGLLSLKISVCLTMIHCQTVSQSSSSILDSCQQWMYPCSFHCLYCQLKQISHSNRWFKFAFI